MGIRELQRGELEILGRVAARYPALSLLEHDLDELDRRRQRDDRPNAGGLSLPERRDLDSYVRRLLEDHVRETEHPHGHVLEPLPPSYAIARVGWGVAWRWGGLGLLLGLAELVPLHRPALAAAAALVLAALLLVGIWRTPLAAVWRVGAAAVVVEAGLAYLPLTPRPLGLVGLPLAAAGLVLEAAWLGLQEQEPAD